jgi:hypothetical protein
MFLQTMDIYLQVYAAFTQKTNIDIEFHVKQERSVPFSWVQVTGVRN